MSKDIFTDNSRLVQKIIDMPLYQVDIVSDSEIYQRYKSGSDKVLIIRITTTGTVITYEKTNDLWANRATATYIPIDQDF